MEELNFSNEEGYDEGFVGGGNSSFAEIRYMHEACAVCHQGSATQSPTCHQNAHPRAGV